MACTRRSRSAVGWRCQRSEVSLPTPSPVSRAAQPIAQMMRALRGTDASLSFPEEWLAPLRGLLLEELLHLRSGLPRLRDTLRGRGGTDALRVCFLGGSVTEQRNGYRPRLGKWLAGAAAAAGVQFEEVPAFCGNCGSKVLAFMIADWVVARRPQLVFVELAINDGDTLLESSDEEGVGAAMEGIVRHVRDALPRCEICMLHMFVRDDLPLHLRSGTKAWADNEDVAAALTYHERVPELHGRVCERYGIPSISLSPLMARVPSSLRSLIFRDDCHFNDNGAAFVATALCAALRSVLDCGGATTNLALSLPPPVHKRPWGRGRTEEVSPQQLSFFYVKPPDDPAERQAMSARLLQRHTQLDMDPLNNAARKPWWLLYAGDHAQLRFSGTRLGFLTMVGPDAGIVSCEVDGGAYRSRVCLLDKWAYYWRLAVVGLVDALPPGQHHAVVRFEHERPDASILKKRPSGSHWESFRREGKDHKLWLMHWLIEEEGELERAVALSGRGSQLTMGRLGGSGPTTGGRKAD
ncbi:hypothetical protein AB1Y20_019287 [Prymnesium parvum]|uniref:SGNH hydrolase-type esterase domain-containing protein n=1 Tax=Prymnesium parvum TaxID=97485 RepID=A0AB34JTP0_PRYPA